MSNYKKIESIKPPVAFNPYKHHLGFLKEQIEIWRTVDWAKTEADLLNMGNNLIDLYYGKLTVSEICLQSIQFAGENGITGPDTLRIWLHPHHYRKMKLSDQSLWVIRLGNDDDRYLHIHPAKNSPCTLRVRAATIKTVVAVSVLPDRGEESCLRLSEVNRIRKEKLGLSPVRRLERGKGIAGLFSFFAGSFNC